MEIENDAPPEQRARGPRRRAERQRRRRDVRVRRHRRDRHRRDQGRADLQAGERSARSARSRPSRRPSTRASSTRLNRPSLAQTFQRARRRAADRRRQPPQVEGLGLQRRRRPRHRRRPGQLQPHAHDRAAEALVDWLATDPTGSGDPDVLLIGDMNSYTFEDPITTFVDGGFVNLVRQFGGLDPYSYVFNGESGYLDHALASPSLAAQATGATDWHINPDEPTVLDYNVEFKTANQVTTFYDPGPYRASDHDPVVIGLDLAGAPGVDARRPVRGRRGRHRQRLGDRLRRQRRRTPGTSTATARSRRPGRRRPSPPRPSTGRPPARSPCG